MLCWRLLLSAATGSRRDWSRVSWGGNSAEGGFCLSPHPKGATLSPGHPWVGPSSLVPVCAWPFCPEKQRHQRRRWQQPSPRPSSSAATAFLELTTQTSGFHPPCHHAGSRRGWAVCRAGRHSLASLHGCHSPGNSPAPRGAPQPGQTTSCVSPSCPRTACARLREVVAGRRHGGASQTGGLAPAPDLQADCGAVRVLRNVLHQQPRSLPTTAFSSPTHAAGALLPPSWLSAASLGLPELPLPGAWNVAPTKLSPCPLPAGFAGLLRHWRRGVRAVLRFVLAHRAQALCRWGAKYRVPGSGTSHGGYQRGCSLELPPSWPETPLLATRCCQTPDSATWRPSLDCPSPCHQTLSSASRHHCRLLQLGHPDRSYNLPLHTSDVFPLLPLFTAMWGTEILIQASCLGTWVWMVNKMMII